MRTDGKATFEILVWDPDHAEGLDIIGFQSEDFLKLKFTIYFNVSDVLLEKSWHILNTWKNNIFPQLPDDDTTILSDIKMTAKHEKYCLKRNFVTLNKPKCSKNCSWTFIKMKHAYGVTAFFH